jgi:hypothetical protein
MTLNIKNLLIICLVITIIGSGCTHYYYVPSVQNVPLFREKNEYQISGIYAEGDESKCIEVQGAYAVSDKIGLKADFLSAKGGDEPSKDFGNGYYFDGAIGYYNSLSKYAVFEIYGGVGGSKQHHQYSQTTGTSDLKYIKSFIQPSFGLTFDFLDIAVSTQLSRLSYTDIQNNINGNAELSNSLYNLMDKGHFFLEPAFTLRGGWKAVKLQFQISYSKYLNQPELFFGEEYHVSIGLRIAMPGGNKKNVSTVK